ncbi:MAG: hypothetical protein RLZZ383_2950 [Pseudomonadota bacterium]|jgi:parvulin-like peptidyl-prolyl isomerase
MRHLALALALTISGVGLTLTACGGRTAPAGGAPSLTAAPEALVGTTLATVNGAKVGTLAFDPLAQRRPPADGQGFSAEEKQAILDEVIVEELLFQEAMNKGLFHDPKVKKILVNALLRQDVYDAVKNDDFTAAQLQSYFDANRETFVIPEKVQIKRILLVADANRDAAATAALATELAAKVKANPDAFTELAAQYSADPFARRGGDLGFLSAEGKPGVPPEVIQKALGAAAGDVVEPFEAGGGWNIVFVPARRERIDRTFDQMQSSVLRKMKNDRYLELQNALVERLKGAAKIEVDTAALSAYAPAAPTRPAMPIAAEAPRPPVEGGGEAGAPPSPEDELGDAEAKQKAMQAAEAEAE